MISFMPTEEEKHFVEVAKKIALEKIRPTAREDENKRCVSKKVIQSVKELGLLNLELPESWGGLNLPLISQVLIQQALSYGDLSIVQGLPGLADAASCMRLLPDNDVFQRYKRQLTEDETTIALIDMSDQEEPFGSLILSNSDDGYHLNGTSLPVRLATTATYILVFACDTKEEPVVFLLDKNKDHTWDVVQGDYRLGLLVAGIARLSFENVRISNDHIIARGNDAAKIITVTQTRVRILQAAKQLGLMEAALDYATEYTSVRKAFGQEIAQFQGVSFRVAKMAIETRVAQHLVWQAALKVDEDNQEANGYASRALSRAHRSLRYVTDSAVQLLGGHGYVDDHPVEKWMRDTQAQVMLYGREKELLITRGEQVIAETKEVTTT